MSILKEIKVKILNAEFIPGTKYKEIIFTLSLEDKVGEKESEYQTKLALIYSDDNIRSDKTPFVKIDSNTGKIDEQNPETLTIDRPFVKTYSYLSPLLEEIHEENKTDNERKAVSIDGLIDIDALLKFSDSSL